MDKLEKALEKAREERAQRLTEGTASAPKARAAAGRSASSVPVLSEEVLERNRIVAHRPLSKEADVVRLLRAQVLQAMAKANMKTLALTSPNYGEGKTTLAINLALSIAMDLNQTVLLVDLDLRKPSVAPYLGLKATKGLTNHLIENTPLPECLVRLPFERMSILPAGEAFDNSSEILGSPRMGTLAEELRERYPDRMIIYDMPPILAQDDPLTFLPHIDGLVMIVQEGRTGSDDLKRAFGILTQARVIGTVLNDSFELPAKRKTKRFS